IGPTIGGENSWQQFEPRDPRAKDAAVEEKPAEVHPSAWGAKEIVNSIGMKLVLIPAGKFLMGSPATDADRFGDEGPHHEVQITQPFYLGKYVVTRGQFRQFVEATRYLTEAEKDGRGCGYNADKKDFDYRVAGRNWLNPGFEQTDDHPVVNVSW